MIKYNSDAIAEKNKRKPGIVFSPTKGSTKKYTIFVPDYDNDRPDRIIPLAKMTNVKEAQEYYEIWTSEHKRQYEERLNGNIEAEQAKINAKEKAKNIKELQDKINSFQHREQTKNDKIDALEAIARQSEKAYAKEKEEREHLQTELEKAKQELKDIKKLSSVKEQKKLISEVLSLKTVNEQQKKELDTLNKKLKNSESNEENLKIQIAAKERSNTMLLDTLSKLNIELNSEKGYHAGEVRILKQQNATLKKELENSQVTKYKKHSRISLFVAIIAIIISIGSITYTCYDQKYQNEQTNIVNNTNAAETDTISVSTIDSLPSTTINEIQKTNDQITKTAKTVVDIFFVLILFTGITVAILLQKKQL